MALDIGAAPAGHWSGCHGAVGFERPTGRRPRCRDRFQKHGYPFGIVVNAHGKRFIDEGLDFHSYTYAKYGREVMNQPGLLRLAGLRPEDAAPAARRIPHRPLHQGKGGHVGGTGRQDGGCRPQGLPRHDPRFNAAGGPPTRRSTPTSMTPAHPRPGDRQEQLGAEVDTCPTRSMASTRQSPSRRGLEDLERHRGQDAAGTAIPGLFAAGEIIGGLYYHNYASGTGLMAAAFGRIAGRTAAAYVRGGDHGEPR